MSAIVPILDHPASVPDLRQLLAAKAITAQDAKSMEAVVRRDLSWKLWTDRGLLVLAILLIITGIGYFFAANSLQLAGRQDERGKSARWCLACVSL